MLLSDVAANQSNLHNHGVTMVQCITLLVGFYFSFVFFGGAIASTPITTKISTLIAIEGIHEKGYIPIWMDICSYNRIYTDL